jgi:hypothetical protein
LVGEQSVVWPIKVDGPFGSRHQNYLKEDAIVFAAAGTGMAALAPFVNDCIRNEVSFSVVWVCRHLEDVTAYPELFESLKKTPERLTIHVTRDIPRVQKEVKVKNTIEDQKESTTVSSSIEGPKTLGLAFLVFFASIAGYSVGRILVFDYNLDQCMRKDAQLLPGWTHFLCFYYYAGMPFIYAALFAVSVGIVYNVAMSKYSSTKESSAPSELILAKIEDISNSFAIVNGRPVWNDVLTCSPKIFSIGSNSSSHTMSVENASASTQPAVITAGPEKMVKEIELICLKNGTRFYRESWKV